MVPKFTPVLSLLTRYLIAFTATSSVLLVSWLIILAKVGQSVTGLLQCSAADDDPLPAVESLQISGDAFPGRELLASGYSLNGTTSCNFEVLLMSASYAF